MKPVPLKCCTKCKREKPLTEFYRQRSNPGPDGHTSRCRRCISLKSLARYYRLRAKGLCYHCGGPARPGKSTCDGQAWKQREEYAARPMVNG